MKAHVTVEFELSEADFDNLPDYTERDLFFTEEANITDWLDQQDRNYDITYKEVSK